MSANELKLFESFARNSETYVEFGTGGSTVFASDLVKKAVVSVDTSKEWLDKVKQACTGKRLVPTMFFVDLGEVGNWGYPVDRNNKEAWPLYYEGVWGIDGVERADLFMIDGRFRVACFLNTLIKCKDDAVLGFHDFASRTSYHIVRQVAREIATSEDMSFFLPVPSARERAKELLQKYRYVLG